MAGGLWGQSAGGDKLLVVVLTEVFDFYNGLHYHTVPVDAQPGVQLGAQVAAQVDVQLEVLVEAQPLSRPVVVG